MASGDKVDPIPSGPLANGVLRGRQIMKAETTLSQIFLKAVFSRDLESQLGLLVNGGRKIKQSCESLLIHYV